MAPAPMDLEKPTAAGEGAGDSGVPTSQLAAEQVNNNGWGLVIVLPLCIVCVVSQRARAHRQK